MPIESGRNPDVNGDLIWTQDIWGKDGTNRVLMAQIRVYVDGTVGANQVPSRFEFWTANSSGTLTKALTIDAAQTVPTFNISQVLKLSGVETGITAGAGGGQGNAVALSATKTVHNITTVSSGNDSVKLPASTGGGTVHWVKNSAAANSAQLFGNGTDTIDGVAAATGVAVAAGKSRLVCDFASGTWLSILGA